VAEQLGLFGALEPSRRPVGSAPAGDELRVLAARIPARIHLGTSSWSFPGWKGIVYDREASESELAKDGLAALARHPLLRAVGIDRSYYAPLDPATFRRYAESVPDDFRFVVKAHQELTVPGKLFLDHAYAVDRVIAPFVEGLGAKAGPLVFQFQPGAAAKPDELARFLAALPPGPLYAVELRTRGRFDAAWIDALVAANAVHVVTVHHTMPSPATQARVAERALRRALVVRWNLGSGHRYEVAKARYAPFDKIVEPDDPTRDEVAALALELERPAYVTVNNKAEGCSPLTVERLARAIAG
jgi:uncharacterized protein YecE (DUF72 family)